MRRPHWHAQVEVNFIFRGYVQYQMSGHKVLLRQGEMALFWGGLPHQVLDTDEDTLFAAMHVPLVHYFRLRLSAELTSRITHGATIVTVSPDGTDAGNFERWASYMASGDPKRRDHAIEELLLRIDRMQFDAFALHEPAERGFARTEQPDQQSYANIQAICDFIAENFRQDIDSSDIASSADIHPKYAMNVFKKSTGMTLNEYVNLLRLSYAQALLLRNDSNVLHIAMESGFGSLSAFNKSFRKIAGMSPSDFRRDMRLRPADLANQHA